MEGYVQKSQTFTIDNTLTTAAYLHRKVQVGGSLEKWKNIRNLALWEQVHLFSLFLAPLLYVLHTLFLYFFF